MTMFSAPTGATAVTLDELFSTLTPADAAELRAAVPPELLARYDAATAATESAARQAMAPGHSRRREHVDTPAWVRLGLLDTYLAGMRGRADTCVHAPSLRRPDPAISAAWKPGLVVCLNCPHLLRLPRNSAADRRCDGCGVDTRGTGGVRPVTLTFGPLQYRFGTCRGCYADMRA